jgi:hypothetical protein
MGRSSLFAFGARIMRTRSRSSRAVALPLAILLTAGSLPLDITPAEAGGIKFRFRTGTAARHIRSADHDVGQQSRSPIRIRIGRSSSSSSSSADDQDGKAQPRPEGAAAAAAARAHAALEAERAQNGGSPTVYEAKPLGKTTEYSGGVTCVAGC